jgi:predicted AAA+ superfamily ATPase
MINRKQQFIGLGRESAFLWGPRQVGKSTLLKALFPQALTINLLRSGDYRRFAANPSLLREVALASARERDPIIIDEAQKVPALLDEAQELMVEHERRFIFCGSSARKLKRGGGNLLGGRALRYELFPLVYPEIQNFDLTRALNHGLLPRHYLGDQPRAMMEAYVGDYLKEEVFAEALTRNLPAFSRFLEAAAFSNGSLVNAVNMARECGVSSPTVSNYFQILEDTLLARFVPSFQKRPKRRVIQAPRFYFFEVGLVNHLLKRGQLVPGSPAFGDAFEHWIYQEISAHRRYSGKNYPLAYWRTASQLEVDFILGDAEVAVEVKSTDQAQSHHMKGLQAFLEEYKVKRAVLVTRDPLPRKAGPIDILPWETFMQELWTDRLL